MASIYDRNEELKHKLCLVKKYELSIKKLSNMMYADKFLKIDTSHISQQMRLIQQSFAECIVDIESKKQDLQKEERIEMLNDFIKDRIKVDVFGSVNDEQLYETFRAWHILFIGRNVPKGKQLFTYITEKFGNKVGRGWKGISILDEEELMIELVDPIDT